MNSRIRAFALAGALCGLALALAGCGESSSNSSSSSSSSGSSLRPALDGSGENLTNGTKGGTLTVYDHEDFQHLDPGQSYSSLDYQVIYATQSPLYFFPPNNSTQVVPLLAYGLAIVSNGGKTVTVHIRHGVKYSPPVNREVTSADVAYAIERGANPNVANPYFRAYFDYLVGGSKANGGQISGISTPDKYTIVFHLTGPYGSFFTGALSLPLTSPVPKEFAAPLDAKKPTQYGEAYEAVTGPYMLQANSKGKFLGIGYQPGKSATLVRNPNWSPTGDPRPAYLNRININIGGDLNLIGRKVLAGSHAIQNDAPSEAIVKLAYAKYYTQLVAAPGAGEFYVALNNKQGPFSNIDLRKALWAALDREAMVKASGGQVTGALGTHFIYPGSVGYDLAGGDHGPNVDYNNHPAGNMAVAAKYMKLAGFPSGEYSGPYTVRVVGANGDPADETSAIANHAVEALGFKTKFTLVDQPVRYRKYCGDPRAEIDVCPNVGRIRDWADPQTLLDPTFAGYNISMKAAEQAQGAQRRAAAWAKVDGMLSADAVAVPWDFTKQPKIESRDVRGINDLWNIGSWNYAYTSLK